MRPARHSLGFDVVLRVISSGAQNTSELEILRKLATGKHALSPFNHVLPMFQEIQFEDVVIGVFPFVTSSAMHVFEGRSSSVQDVIKVILQMLEVTLSSDLLTEYMS